MISKVRFPVIPFVGFIGLSLLWVSGSAVAQSSQRSTVEGHVLRLDKSPVFGASVEIHSFSAMSGILPQPVLTDENGYFYIEYPPSGQGWVTASKIDEGYPNAALALYGRGGYNSLQIVDLEPGKFLNVELRFGKPDATLDYTVIDTSNRPIRNASILIQWPDDPQAMISSSVSADGTFHFVLPRHAVSIEISAPGYFTWHFRDPKSGLSTLSAKDAAHISVTAVLHPVDSP